MNIVSTLILLGASIFVLGACANTFSGVGKDIENTGEYIQDVFE